MQYDIEPLYGAGSIHFGATAEEVRTELGANFTSFRRTPSAAFPCDFYESLSVFVYYKVPGIVEAVEFAHPADVRLEGVSLLTLSFAELTAFLHERDSLVEVEIDSATSYGLGVGAYAPRADEAPDEPAESIIVFERGYYD